MSADAPIILSDDDDEPTLLANDGSRRSGLFVAPSGLAGLAEPGLWTSGAIAPGAFIALYTGRIMAETDYYNLPPAEQDALNKYALALGGSGVLVLPGAAPDLARHPAAAANEPLRGGVANALVETQEAAVGGARYVFAALFACAAGIPAQTEVLWWYGASYEAVRKAVPYKAGRACSSAGHALTPSPEAIVRRVLEAGQRDDALYERGAQDAGSSGSSEADSDPDFEEAPKRRRQAAQQPPRQQPSRRIATSGTSVVDAVFARLGLVATAMPAQKRTIDELTTDADSSEPESGRVAPSPPFSALCRCLEALEVGPKPGGPLPSADIRTAILRRFFSLHLPAARATHAHLLLLLLPSEDPRRYNLGQARLAAAAARALGLPTALKEHVAYAECRGDDFGEALRGVVSARASGGALGAPLSTADVDGLLTRHADGDAAALPTALQRVGPLEAKWLARLFLRDLKIGTESWVNTDPRKLTLAKLVLNAYSDGLFDFYTHRGEVRVAVRAAQAARAARLRAGLPAVGAPRGVADPGAPYLDPALALGTYVAVQNATPVLSLAELPKKLGSATMVSVGQKHDGERLQLHVFPSAGPDLDPTASVPRYRRDGVEYTIFSRGGNNSTFRRALALPALAAALGHVVSDLGASPEQQWLADAHGDALRAAAGARAQPPVRSVILDAEVLVYDRERRQVEEFGFVQSMAPSNNTSMAAVREGKKNLMVVVFDVLHYNGRDLVNEGAPLREREVLLRTILEPIPTFVEVVPTEHVRADDEQGLLASLGRAVRAKQEGLVIKRLDAPYLPNGRVSWFKLKPAAIPGVGDTLTLGLIGVRVGNGVNAGKITAYALGAVQNIHAVTEDGEPPRWAWLFNTPIAPVPIARVLTELCLGSAAVEAPLMRRVEPSTAVGWLHGAPTGADDRLHLVARHPRTSILAVEVTGQGFVRANAMFGASSTSKYELRFPKINAMRSPTPGVDFERIVGLRAYQELGEAAVLGPVTDARVRAVCDRVKNERE